ncbi:hypothetical protein NUU61_000432 [Penicillium alfredii]|uniref:Uncharacterized protein n=1 Tax=Penicillium alfredii TaxID=1506179 RepID=A0A9W9KR25_9EURO|nr:uncharacterized protein NUU61_000432 [Penicillium alfredii]KAJ5114673.1 hypothetical protein NUU61_000432 [Penicillium alfredii]
MSSTMPMAAPILTESKGRFRLCPPVLAGGDPGAEEVRWDSGIYVGPNVVFVLSNIVSPSRVHLTTNSDALISDGIGGGTFWRPYATNVSTTNKPLQTYFPLFIPPPNARSAASPAASS